MSQKSEEILNMKLPVFVNGKEKQATGLTKKTTVDDLKFAILSVSDSKFNSETLEDFGVFEQWQGNERILDGKIKVYKLLRVWQSLPGDQLSQVKFVIKKRLQDFNVVKSGPKSNSLKQTLLQALSPLRKTNLPKEEEESCKRYSAIKKINRSRKSTIKTHQMKQNENQTNDILKMKYLDSLEKELQKLANLSSVDHISLVPQSKDKSNSSSISSSSLNSVGSTRSNQRSVNFDSESDTGISSLNSYEFSSRFETLV